MTPELPPNPTPRPPEPEPPLRVVLPPLPQPEPEPPPPGFLEKLGAVLFCVFCLELGIFLLVYPWLGHLWQRNWLFHLRPEWTEFLLSEEFRGGVSGLGILNIFVGVIETFRLRRFSRK